jgi:hypothetical protein
MLAMTRRAVNVVKVEVKRRGGVQAPFSVSAEGTFLKRSCTGRSVEAVTVTRNSPCSGQSVPISKTSGRPKWVRVKRRNAQPFLSAAAGRKIERNNSPEEILKDFKRWRAGGRK